MPMYRVFSENKKIRVVIKGAGIKEFIELLAEHKTLHFESVEDSFTGMESWIDSQLPSGLPPGGVLKACREALGMTQSELSEKSGESCQNLSGLETGRRTISVAKAKTFGAIFGCDYRRFL